MSKALIFLILAIHFFTLVSPCLAYTQVAAYLCELGIQFYSRGEYASALHEFNKALLADPDNTLALSYIQKISTELVTEEERAELPPVSVTLPPTPPPPRKKIIDEYLDRIEKSRLGLPAAIAPAVEETGLPREVYPLEEEISCLILDESISSLRMPIEVEYGKSIIVKGSGISRFLITSPDIIAAEKISQDEIKVSGKNFGHSYIHIWDANGRWTLELLTVPPKPEGPTLEEQMRLAEEKAGTFKLRYYIDWSSFEEGRRIKAFERRSYGYTHSLGLNGQVPYGDIDSRMTVRALNETTDLTYFTLGLTNGRFKQFEDFSLRAFDFSPDFDSLLSPITDLRGAKFSSPAFNKKIEYSLFGGREGGGRYGNLSPGLGETKDSFLSGFNLDLKPTPKQHYDFSLLHGWGDARPADLNRYGYDLVSSYNFDKLKLDYDIAHDSETFAHLFSAAYSMPKFRLTSEFRDTAPDFKTMTGTAYRLGEIGVLSTLYLTPTEKLRMSGRLDVFKDRLFPNPENPDRLNENFNWDANYDFNSLNSLRLDYSLQNELGRIGESRSHSSGATFYQTLEWFKRINTYFGYRRQESKSFSSHSYDFINDKLIAGLRFSLLGELYYYLNKEYNWLEERFSGDHSQPHAMETGLDWRGRILFTPFDATMRLIYRDEENTTSNLSFLSGEDYLEGYTELSYQPNEESQLYCSTRIRNVWAENPNLNKRIEADFRAGMRYFWDTGIRWESVGIVEGCIFKDYNSDGLRQRDEPPVEGIRVWLGKDRSKTSDIFGYYKFTKVKARKAFVNIDTSTVPSGYNLTVPATQEVAVSHGHEVEIDFGIISRSEIIGTVFEDVNLNNQLDKEDLLIKGAVVVLKDGTKAASDEFGRYSFRNISTGRHTLSLDLNSIPPHYIPTVPIFHDLVLFEGVSYSYDIPLKKAGKD